MSGEDIRSKLEHKARSGGTISLDAPLSTDVVGRV